MDDIGDKSQTDQPKQVVVKELLVEELIDEWKLAAMLGVSVGHLARWRRKGGGPVFIQVATTSVRYAASDVQKWIEERKLTKKGQPAPIVK